MSPWKAGVWEWLMKVAGERHESEAALLAPAVQLLSGRDLAGNLLQWWVSLDTPWELPPDPRRTSAQEARPD